MSRFHEGELGVQQRAGVRAEADRVAGMLAPPHLDGGPAHFLGERTFAALTGHDPEGRSWTSPLVGPPGFLDAAATTLRIHTLPPSGDPLRDLPEGQAVGLIVMDFARRRRLRVNGLLAKRTACGMRVDLGTTHPERGVDTSHRGAPPGFVRVEDGGLWWPDYPGNNLFSSFGNLAVDDTAAVLVPDFAAGTSLQLSGRATLDWVPPGSAGDDGGTGRRVRFTVQQVVSGAAT